jgi:hypothetical protein
MLLMANAGVVHATAEDAPQTWRRFVVYLIQTYAEEAASPLHRHRVRNGCIEPFCSRATNAFQ